jgi:hypothetical protein
MIYPPFNGNSLLFSATSSVLLFALFFDPKPRMFLSQKAKPEAHNRRETHLPSGKSQRKKKYFELRMAVFLGEEKLRKSIFAKMQNKILQIFLVCPFTDYATRLF